MASMKLLWGDIHNHNAMQCHAGNSIVATPVDWATANHRGSVRRSLSIGELLDGRVAVPMDMPSSWVVVHRAHPRSTLQASGGHTIREWAGPGYAYLRVTQANGQMAWSSPVFAGTD